MSEPARGSQESGNQLIEGVNLAESTTGTLEYASAVADTAQDLGPFGASTDASFSSSSDGSGPVQLIGESETSQALQVAGAAAGSLTPEGGLLSTGNLPGVTADGPATGGLSLSAASVGAALAATGAPLDVSPVPSPGSPASESVAKVAPSPMPADSTEPHPFVPDPPAPSSLGASAASSGGERQPPPAPFNRPGRSKNSPDTGAFVPREVIARRRAAEAMTRAIVMAPPLPPSMMSAAQQAAAQAAPSLAQPVSGPITQPDGTPQAQTETTQSTRGTAKNRKRKGRKHGAHTAGIPLVTNAPTAPTAPTQPATGPMPMPGAPGTGALPMGYAPQGYTPQGYPQGYAPQGYVPQGYVPQGYVPAGYAPQGYQQGVPTGAMPLSAMGSVGMPTATPPQQQQTPGANPPGRHGPSKGARLAMLLAVIVVIGGIVAGVLVSQNGGDKGDPGAAAASPSPSATAAQAAPTVALDFTASSFDPVGGEGIKIDGASYMSSWYKTAQFGNLKDGVGLILNLGSAKKVSSVSFDVGGSPVTVGLRSADTLAQSDLDAYNKVAAQGKKTGQVTYDTSKAGAHQYWMIWVTSLPPLSDGTYRVTLSDVKVRGPKS